MRTVAHLLFMLARRATYPVICGYSSAVRGSKYSPLSASYSAATVAEHLKGGRKHRHSLLSLLLHSNNSLGFPLDPLHAFGACAIRGMGMPGLVLILLVWQTTRAVVHATSIRGRQHACFDHQSFGEVNSTVVVHHDKSFDHFLSELAGVLEQHHLPKRPINWVFDEDAPLARPHPECHGQWLEFGVYKGGTLNSAAEYRHKYCGQDSPPLYGFDTFTGLPEDWDNPVPEMDMKKGAFSLAGRLPDVRSNVQLVEGIFSDSLPLFLHAHYHEALHVADITYLHIDCDLYQGAIDVLSLLSKHIAPGCILIFDELLNYAAYRDHEAKALWEWLKATQRRIEIIGQMASLAEVALLPTQLVDKLYYND